MALLLAPEKQNPNLEHYTGKQYKHNRGKHERRLTDIQLPFACDQCAEPKRSKCTATDRHLLRFATEHVIELLSLSSLVRHFCLQTQTGTHGTSCSSHVVRFNFHFRRWHKTHARSAAQGTAHSRVYMGKSCSARLQHVCLTFCVGSVRFNYSFGDSDKFYQVKSHRASIIKI